MTTADVATPCAEHREAELDWCLPRDLKGGTRAMRNAGTRWLPKEKGEDKKDYSARLLRSFLYPGFQRTIEEMMAKPFTRTVTVAEGVPDRLLPIEKNADRRGTDLTQFSRAIFDSLLTYGTVHFIVDMPQTGKPLVDNDVLEKDDIRPYFVLVPADRLIGYRTKEDAGRRVITQIRILETASEPDGAWGEKSFEQVRVWTKDSIEAHRRNERGEWFLYETKPNNLGRVPLITIRCDSRSFLYSKSPLQGVADLNLAHWQSQSDQRNVLRYARAGIMLRKGADEKEGPITIGAGASWSTSNPNADLKFIEHSGAGASAGRQDLVDLKAEMAEQALAPMLQQSGDPTATAMAIDEGRANALIHQWIRAMEAGLRGGYETAADWIDVKLPETWDGVDIFSDFGLSIRSSQDVASLMQMRKEREITAKTFLAEVKRRGVLSDTFDVEKEIESLESEGPDLGAVMDELKKARTQPAPGDPTPPGSAPDLKVGDRVKVRSGKAHGADTENASGTIAEISSPAIAVKFDGMGEVHRWYTASELEPEQSPSSGAPASAMGASHGG